MIIGLDVGGTHTDAVLMGPGGLVRKAKVKTEMSDLFNTVLSGLNEITKDLPPEKIRRAVLSTTLTTNSVITGNLPDVGIIITSGPGIDPLLYKTNGHYYRVAGALDHRGREIESLDVNEIQKIADQMKSEGIQNVGVIGKFSSKNPVHENRIAKAIEGKFDKVFLGHHVSGNLNFPRRIATTFLNASVYTIHKEFFSAVKDSLKTKGLNIPIYILKADGGTMSLDSSIDFPAQSILSGPAASIMGAISAAPESKDVIVLDIGGTTTDISAMINQNPVLEPLGIELGGLKTLIRSLKNRSIGIGGDSFVRVEGGKLLVGPERKGPAMAYAGPSPTPTDALIVLGKIEDGDKDKALEGINGIAKELGLSPEAAANKIFETACKSIISEVENIVKEINGKPVYTVSEIFEGYKLEPSHLLTLGGPAKLFAEKISELTGLNVEPVPQWEVANAKGAALARTTCEVTLTADTERAIVQAPEENYSEKTKVQFSASNALDIAFGLLKTKAEKQGAAEEDFQAEVIENLSFNMIRGFRTVGKSIRVQVQVKPGLIDGYEPMALSEDYQ